MLQINITNDNENISFLRSLFVIANANDIYSYIEFIAFVTPASGVSVLSP